MAQDVITRYKVEVDDMLRQLQIAVERIDKLEVESKAAAKGLDQVTKSADKLDKELASTGKSTKTATDNVKSFAKTAKTEFDGVGAAVRSIGGVLAGTLGAFLSADAIVNFSKASVNAFLAAQENAEKLRFTITQVGGESEAAFQRLIDQSKELQNITVFSDDSIQQAQTALANFELTSEEIERLIPLLADYASATKQDLLTATQQVGAGLQGTGRELKKYGIEVSATATATENLAEITRGFTRFQGAAEAATRTMTGQLEQARNKADELQESVGEKLAPAFVRARLALLELASDAVNFLTNTDEAIVKMLKSLGLAPAALEKTGNSFKDFSQTILEQVNATKTLIEFDEVALKLRNDQTKAVSEQQAVVDRLIEARDKALAREVVNLEEVRALNQAIKKQQDTNLQNEISRLNIIEDILTKQRDARTKQDTTAETPSDKRIPGIEKEIKLIESLGAEYADLFALLSEPERQRLLEISIIGEGESAEEIQDKIRQIEQLLTANKIEIPVPVTIEGIPDAEATLRQLIETAETAGIDVSVLINQSSLDAFRQEIIKLKVEADKTLNQIPTELKPRVDNTQMITGLENLQDETLEIFSDTDKQILAASEQLLSSLQALYDQFTSQRIEQIHEQRDVQLAAYDAEQERVDDLFKKRRISETEAQRLTESLAAKRLETQTQADRKERALKKKQFEIDRIAALARIIINTAEAVTAALTIPPPAGPILAALNAAAGAAEGVLVAGQVNPYKKGSKSTKKGLALVGEEGPELMMMPAQAKILPAKQTKNYGEAIEAMRQGSFDTYVSETYIAPELEKQQNRHKEAKSKQFADNLSQSIILNSRGGITGWDLEQTRKKGQPVTNADEIGQSTARHIAQYLQKDIYR